MKVHVLLLPYQLVKCIEMLIAIGSLDGLLCLQTVACMNQAQQMFYYLFGHQEQLFLWVGKTRGQYVVGRGGLT